MKDRATIGILILWALSAIQCAAQPSYYWQQMQRKPDAKTSQEFFFRPGTNMVFTYTNNLVYLNATGGGGTNSTVGVTTNFSVLFANTGGTNTLYFSNGLLVAISAGLPPGFLLLPGGGNMIQPGGGKFIIP